MQNINFRQESASLVQNILLTWITEIGIKANKKILF